MPCWGPRAAGTRLEPSGAQNVAIKRLTFRRRGPIRFEMYFTFKPEATELKLGDTDLRSVFRLSKACLRGMMKARHGRIINISSVAGIQGAPTMSMYSAAKGGVRLLSQSVAKELAGSNVRVNAICPGLIETGMTAELFEWARSTGRAGSRTVGYAGFVRLGRRTLALRSPGAARYGFRFAPAATLAEARARLRELLVREQPRRDHEPHPQRGLEREAGAAALHHVEGEVGVLPGLELRRAHPEGHRLGHPVDAQLLEHRQKLANCITAESIPFLRSIDGDLRHRELRRR